MIIGIAEFLLLVLFYAAYFRKQLALKKQGIDTNRLGRGEKPPRTARVERVLYLFTVLTAVVQFASVPFYGRLRLMSLPGWVQVAGIAVTGAGVVFFVLATTSMGQSWRAGVDRTQETAMITGGVYRYSRNPAFVGFDLLYIGSFLAAPNVVLLIFMLFSIVLLHLQIQQEEAYLLEVFGEEYQTYKQKVPRYLFWGERGDA